jgi:undecaprenyl pyrophosphate phosphatase UppP
MAATKTAQTVDSKTDDAPTEFAEGHAIPDALQPGAARAGATYRAVTTLRVGRKVAARAGHIVHPSHPQFAEWLQRGDVKADEDE